MGIIERKNDGCRESMPRSFAQNSDRQQRMEEVLRCKCNKLVRVYMHVGLAKLNEQSCSASIYVYVITNRTIIIIIIKKEKKFLILPLGGLILIALLYKLSSSFQSKFLSIVFTLYTSDIIQMHTISSLFFVL